MPVFPFDVDVTIFAAAVGAGDVARGKHPSRNFLRAAATMDVPPAECCVFEGARHVIEAARHAIEAARRAGMNVVAITPALPAAELGAARELCFR